METNRNEIEQRIEKFKAVVKKAGIKLTHQRLEIFREIASSEDHPDAISVYNSLREKLPTVSLDTVYRTLWTLNELGLITVLGSRRETVRFDANIKQHHHFICVKCGMVRDFESAELDSLEVQNDVQQFGSVVGAQIEVRGICNACKSKSNEVQI